MEGGEKGEREDTVDWKEKKGRMDLKTCRETHKTRQKQPARLSMVEAENQIHETFCFSQKKPHLLDALALLLEVRGDTKKDTTCVATGG